MFCKICNKNIDVESNKHPWRVHNLTLEDYYLKYEPRFDVFDGSPIVFKTPRQYLEADFNTKNNLKEWLKLQSDNKIKEFCKDLLLKRKNNKNLIYAPSHFELRGLMMPSVVFYHKKFGPDYYNTMCHSIGLKTKYDYNINQFNINIDKNIEIIIDTRESSPYKFTNPKIQSTIQKLDCGDYCTNPNPNKILVERKSVVDAAGTLSNGYERFRKEIRRAKELGFYVIMVIESTYSDFVSINYLPHTKFIKASSDFLFKRIRDLYVEFDNFQVVCRGTRKECIGYVEKLLYLALEMDIRNLDLQFLLDTKIII